MAYDEFWSGGSSLVWFSKYHMYILYTRKVYSVHLLFIHWFSVVMVPTPVRASSKIGSTYIHISNYIIYFGGVLEALPSSSSKIKKVEGKVSETKNLSISFQKHILFLIIKKNSNN